MKKKIYFLLTREFGTEFVSYRAKHLILLSSHLVSFGFITRLNEVKPDDDDDSQENTTSRIVGHSPCAVVDTVDLQIALPLISSLFSSNNSSSYTIEGGSFSYT